MQQKNSLASKFTPRSTRFKDVGQKQNDEDDHDYDYDYDYDCDYDDDDFHISGGISGRKGTGGQTKKNTRKKISGSGSQNIYSSRHVRLNSMSRGR